MNKTKNITMTLRRPFAGAALCALALAGALSLTGCRKQGVPASKGDGVLFSAGIGGSESGTKTSYTDSNASDRSKAENINWLSGDQIRIWSAECSEPTDHYADYIVTPESTATSAKIAVNPGTVGLRWGEAETDHHFYSVYPSPLTTGKTSDSGEFAGNAFTFTGHIPKTQDISIPFGGTETHTVVNPDMANLYMVSKATATPESDGAGVFLKFTPITTAIQFTISKDSANEDEVLEVALESDSHELNGAFIANISGWTPAESGNYVYPVCTSANNDKEALYNKVTINLEGKSIKVSNNKYLTFTFFLLPLSGDQNVVNDLSFIIKKKDNDNTETTLKTKLSKADGTGIPFPTHKKTYVKGILVPDGLVTLSVTTTDYDFEDPTDPTTVGSTDDYNEQGSSDPTTDGDTSDYGSEDPTDPTTGGSTGDYGSENPTDPTTGGSTGDYGSENPTDPTTGGSTGDYNVNDDINIFPKPLTPLPGVFTVSDNGTPGDPSDDKKVQFSRGNLQATYNGTAYTWGFAANQYDYVGNAAGNTSIDNQTSGAVVDLFGWSTASTTYGINTSTAASDYSGDFVDWGTAIDNNGTWRTLSKDEWGYLLNTRATTTNTGTDNARYAKATVNNQAGIILLPNTYSHPSGVTTLTNINTDTATYDVNTYSVTDWTAMETAGAVFLPAAGYRLRDYVDYVGDFGYYWSSTAVVGNFACRVYFHSSYVSPAYYSDSRANGYSVRLITESK